MAETETRVIVAPEIRTEDLPSFDAEIQCVSCRLYRRHPNAASWAHYLTCCGATLPACDDCHDYLVGGPIEHKTGCGRIGRIDRWWRL